MVGQTRTTGSERVVQIQTSRATLHGSLVVPEGARAIVAFAHGSGSSRHSPRNRYVAGVLQEAGLATLLVDLLTPEEEVVDRRTGHLRFDIDLLADRLTGAAEWLGRNRATASLRIGFFGASTGGGAALVAAGGQPGIVSAVVSRGGRPDLAGAALAEVQAATLLIVGGEDEPVIRLNRAALEQLGAANKELVIVPEATHLFEEPGALEEVAKLAADWFTRFLQPETRP
jgi:putative phosphoribosyl transferase